MLRGAADTGWDAVGLDLWSVEEFLADGGSVADLGRLVAGCGLPCTDLVALRIDDDEAAVTARTDLLLDVAAATGAAVVAATFRTDPDGRAVERLGRAVERFHAAGIRVALEPVPYLPLATIDAGIGVCESLGWERIGLLVDSWHVLLADELAAARSLAARAVDLPAHPIVLVQVGDARRDEIDVSNLDELADHSHRHRLLPGDGDLGLHGFVDAIRATGFDGPLAPEVLSDAVRAAPPAWFAVQALRSLDRVLAPAS